jgi:NAD-dependent deacetylase
MDSTYIEKDSNIEKLNKLIESSRYVVAITGAGISVSTGIMDFEKMNVLKVMQMTSKTVLKTAPKRYYKMAYETFLKPMFENGPSLSHQKLADLEKQGKIKGIITTNIDHLHTMAGSTNVAEIQGSFAINKCQKCGKRHNDINIWNMGSVPRCDECGGIIGAFPIYSHIGLYDQDVSKARTWISNADLILIIGSNGSYGGSYFPYINPKASIVQINPKATQFDELSVINIYQNADDVLSKLTL